jgi:arylesterase/paraoxonase
MGAGSVIAVTVVAALGGILLQPTKEILTTAGFWRDVQPINDFPYTCRKIEHPQLEGCEDLWIDEKGRELYLACSDTISRTQWCPS